MCGFVGILTDSTRPAADAVPAGVIERMNATLVHRGPDDQGTWIDPEAGIHLAHRRLSIIDLSPEGRQPMVSTCGRYVIVYNGEIYNFKELRRELESRGHRFRGHSDTEVLLAAIAEWGVAPALRRSNGMFALALWDRNERRLHLARDRVGKKPLYYGWSGRDLVFGSELKALRPHPRFSGEIDRTALTLFLRYSYVPAPYSIYRGVFKLPQGTILTLSAKDLEQGGSGMPQGRRVTYWNPIDAAAEGDRGPFPLSGREAVDALDGLLGEATRQRLYADVPLGAFLSGGIDSSTVVALMQRQSDRPVRTFSIGFHHEHDEAAHARAVADHLGTDHTELYVTGEDALKVVPRLPELFDEPFGDSSQIPTFIISALARRHVKVALSGDGGDELFFGYRRYFRGRRIWNAVRRLPHPVRHGFVSTLRGAASRATAESRLHKLAADLDARTLDAMFLNRVSMWRDPTALVVGGGEKPTAFDEVVRAAPVADPSRRMMLLDLVTYLADDILVKVDRASMGVGLEVRAPLLDHRVVDFALRLPVGLKYRGGKGKWILRQVLERYVPPRLTDRPKTGFGAPVRLWLRGPLLDWSRELLDPRRLEREGLLRPEPIRRMWDENLSGKRKWHNHLWNVLMFQAWSEHR